MIGVSRIPADAFQVSLNGLVVAHLHQRGDYTWLEWQDGYWDDPQRPILGLRFEDRPSARVSSALRLPPWFSNLLPEGRLRDWVARDAGVRPEREMMLLRRLGTDLPGAVTVTPVDGSIDPRWRPDELTSLSPTSPPATSPSTPRFSLAGVALKFSMLQQEDRLTLPAHDQHGDWIVKLPDAVYPGVPENEFAMMTLAKAVGIDVPPIRLIHRDELPPLPREAWPQHQEWAYAIQRFDRTATRRIHMEDIAQVKGVYADAKYDGSFATVASYIYRKRDTRSYLEFIRRLFFSYAIGNGDMHLKNVSLLYADARLPTISPAYDLLCTAPYRFPDEEDLGLRLGRSRRFADVTASSFEALAHQVGAPRDETAQTITEVASRLLDGWQSAQQGMDQLPDHRRWLDDRLPKVAQAFG